MTREPSFDFIPRIDDHPSVKRALSRIEEAMERKEKVIVYGDYDTDGIMATSIVYRSFLKRKKPVSFYIPSRYKDGYGLNLENAKKIAGGGYKLVILVDNGVSCFDEVSYLLSQGIDTIIIDHHSLPEALPPSYAIVHPETLHYGEVPVSAGYLSFLFSVAMLKEVDPYLLTLGALSTISDLMPIKAHNREIVRLCLRHIRKLGFPQILSLTGATRIDERVLSMDVIPVINAVGRMDLGTKANRLIHYFGDDFSEASEAIAVWMKENNAARKEATIKAEEKLRVEEDEPGICAIGTLPEGLNGLLANRLMDRYEKPTAIFSPAKADPGLYVGSIRSKNGFSVLELEQECADLIEKGGGHLHAGGLSIKKGNYGEFRERFLSYSASHPFVKEEVKAIPILESEINMETFRLIRELAPFGMDYPEPVFSLSSIAPARLAYTRDGRFLSFDLKTGARLFSFSFGKEDFDSRLPFYSFLGTLQLNEWKGTTRINFMCELEGQISPTKK